METIRVCEHGARVRGRVSGRKVHDQISRALKASGRVQLDFEGVESVGPTFLGEVLGTLVARYDPSVLGALVFTKCSKSVEASIVLALRGLTPFRGLVQFS